MISVALICTRRSPSDRIHCPIYEASIPLAEVEAWYAKQLTEHGWTMEDGKPYCARHNPGDRGAIVQLTEDDYRPLGDSGWEARIPDGADGYEKVEIRQRRGGDDA